MRFIVLGIIGRTPVAGVAWQALHYLEGLRRLGHDVYYVEDTQVWPHNPETDADDSKYTVNYISRLMDWCGLRDRWAFYDISQPGRVYGLSDYQLRNLCNEADALINVTGSTTLRDDWLRVPVRVYLETDPGVPQIEVDQGNRFTIDLLSSHTHHFTFAESIGKTGCLLPLSEFLYRPTRQPIVIDWWHQGSSSAPGNYSDKAAFTTVTSWNQSNDIVWNGELYTWSKDRQFLKFIDLPKHTSQTFELALACDDGEVIERLMAHRWRITDAAPLTKDILPYRDYICRSRGEFTVAKDQYARLHTGWFSDRSASYLAAGRPVITQDTGFDDILPTGLGLFSFNTLDEILTAVEAINSAYDKHCRAARDIAEQYFKAEIVIQKLLDDIGL